MYSKCTSFNNGGSLFPGKRSIEKHVRATVRQEKYIVREKRIYHAQKDLYDKIKEVLSISEMALGEELKT